MSYSSLASRIDTRLGQIGASIGQPYRAYRVTSDSSGDFPDGWTFIGSLNAYRYRVAITKLEVSVERSDMLYNLYLDAGQFQLGDVFLCTDPPLSPGVSYGAGATILHDTIQFDAMMLAWHMPARIPIATRLDRRARIYRPAENPAEFADASLYWDGANVHGQPVVLSGGVYSLGEAGSGPGSWIPLGAMAVTRRSDFPVEKEPGIVRSLAWHAYLPPLRGFNPVEGDRIVTEDGARYVVIGSFNQESGLVGSQMVLDRKVAEN